MTTANAPLFQHPPTWHWLVGFTLVVAAHAALVIAVILPWHDTPISPPAATAPILIDMLPMPVAPPALPPPDPEPIPDPAPEPIIELPPEVPTVENADVALPPPKVKPKPVVQKNPNPPKATESKKKPVEKPVGSPPKTTSSATTVPQSVSQQPAAPTLSSQVNTGAAIQQQRATWQGLLMAHLERLQRYPRSAQMRRQEGIATLALTIDRTGKVLSARLEHESGYRLLDKEAMDLIYRAQPLPAPPESIPGKTISLVVPINFFLH